MLLLTLLIIKHYFADFMLQTDNMLKNKGNYGHVGGIDHALTHGLLTFLVVLSFLGFSLIPTFGVSVLDGVIHYHIDYIKAKFGEKDISKKKFWYHFGLDQLAHYLTYILLCAFIGAI